MSILKYEDLVKITEALQDYESNNLTILINVPNKDILTRINEDYFYRANEEGTPDEVDEIKVDIGGFHFKYVVDDET